LEKNIQKNVCTKARDVPDSRKIFVKSFRRKDEITDILKFGHIPKRMHRISVTLISRLVSDRKTGEGTDSTSGVGCPGSTSRELDS